MAKRPKMLWRLGMIVLAAMASAPIADAQTLEEALVSAYLTNSELNASRAAVRSNDEVLNQALSGYLPNVFLRGTTLSRAGQDSTSDLDQNAAGASVTLDQNLFEGYATDASVRRAYAIRDRSRSELLAVEQRIFFSVVEAYTAVWRDRSVLDLAIANERRLARQLEATRVRFQVGDVAFTDVAQAEARLAAASADIEQARADLAASTADYASFVGEEAGELFQPEVLTDLPESVMEAEDMADRNPLIGAAIAELGVRRNEIDIAYSDLLPELNLTSSVDLEGRQQGAVEYSRSGEIGLQLAIPLYQGGRVRSEVRQAREVLDTERNNLDTERRNVRAEVRTSFDRLLAGGAARESFATEVRANEIALQGVQAEADQGVRTVLDVLDAQQELFESLVNFVRATREEIVASYRLKSAIGMLTVPGLDLDVEPYNADAYAEQNRTLLFGMDVFSPE